MVKGGLVVASALGILLGGQLPGRTGPVVSGTVKAAPDAQEQIRARYDYFKGGRKMWGHGVGRKIAFTFDDGPNYQTTARLLDHLDAFGVKATFFINSRRANRWGLGSAKSHAVLMETHRRGHTIANHTHSHPHLHKLTAVKQRAQIDITNRLIGRITGATSYLFRPPYGALAPASRNYLRKQGSTVVMWNISSDDDSKFNVSKVLHTVMGNLERLGGGIVLMHDTHYWTIESVPPILKSIRIESCVQLARGEEPYEVVGLEHFWVPRAGRQPGRPASEQRAWLARRAALVKLCGSQPRAPLPAFIRGESS